MFDSETDCEENIGKLDMVYTTMKVMQNKQSMKTHQNTTTKQAGLLHHRLDRGPSMITPKSLKLPTTDRYLSV